MSGRAREAALKAWPLEPYIRVFGFELGFRYAIENRRSFEEGYEQAENDIVSLIQSRIDKILGDAQPKPALRAELQELIDKIKES